VSVLPSEREGDRVRGILTWFVPAALAAAVAAQPLEACNDNGSPRPGVGDANAPLDASGSGSASSGQEQNDSSSGGSACPPIPTSDLRAHASPASGTVTGNGLDALLCPGGAGAVILSAGASYDTAPFIFELNYTVAASAADFQFQTPAGADDGELSVLLGIASAAPGIYSSPTGNECGTMALTYYLPVPPGTDCEAGAPPNCPPGCGTICDNIVGGGCEPCEPQPPSVGYSATGSGDCIGDTLTPLGSWMLSLTSLAEDDAGTTGGVTYYAPHGTLIATMVSGGDAGAGSVTLSASF
jgi:hypothetical protein